VDLSSARRKLDRGIEQVNTLRNEAITFEDDEVYEFTTERELRSPQELAYRCFATPLRKMPDHWPLLAGEAIQNLRSALDHAVYVLVPKRKRGKSIFPIYTDCCEFRVYGRGGIPQVPEGVATLIEAAQPYRSRPDNPASDPLEVLRTLSNIDKHRTLAAFTTALLHGPIFGIGWKPPVTDLKTHLRLGDEKAEIASFGVSFPVGVEADQVKVQPIFSYEVRIEGRPLLILTAIARRVFEVVTECETAKPFPPGTPYPFLVTQPNEIYEPVPMIFRA
jgi:hypothetical protein